MSVSHKRLDHFLNLRHQLVGTINEMVQLELSSYDEEHKTIYFTSKVKKWMLNPGKMLHGGIASTLLDMAMGGCAYTFSDAQYVPTISMNVSYINAMHEDDDMNIEAKVLRIGRDVILTSSAIYHHDGTLCYQATASYAIKRKKVI